MATRRGLASFQSTIQKLQSSGGDGSAGAPFKSEIQQTWLQGRSAFGGLSAGIALSAAHTKLAATISSKYATTTETTTNNGGGGVGVVPPLRSVLVSFVGPAGGGEVEATASVLRTGKSVSAVEAKTLQNGQVCTAIQAAFGSSRETSKNFAPLVTTGPEGLIGGDASGTTKFAGGGSVELPKLEDLPSQNFYSKFMPQFLQHFEVRWIHGCPFPKMVSNTPEDIPFDGRRVAAWCRLARPGGGEDSSLPTLSATETAPSLANATVLAICDMVPPVMLRHYMPTPPPVSSLTWAVDFFQPPQEEPAEARLATASDWYYLDFRLLSADRGYSQQSGSIYNSKGQLIAYSRQTMVYFEPSSLHQPPRSKM